MPTQLNIVILTNAGGASGGSTTAATVAVPIPAGLQTLDSGNSTGGGQASQLNTTTGLWSSGQTGFSSVDILIRSIYKAGGFWQGSTWYGTEQIQSIGFQ